MTDTTNAVPPPGSIEAIAMGCTCPFAANAHGARYMGALGIYIYAYAIGCPVHAPNDAPPGRQLVPHHPQTFAPVSL